MKRRDFIGALLGVAVAPAAVVRAAHSVELAPTVPIASGAITANKIVLGRLHSYAIASETIPHGSVTKATLSSVVGRAK